MDNLKAMNANLVGNSRTVLPVLARHDTSESGVGNLNPQPSTPEGSLGEVQNPSQVVRDGQNTGDAEMVTVVEIVEDAEEGTNDGSGLSEMVAQDGQHSATGGFSGSLGQPSPRSQATGAHGLSVPASNRVIGEEPSPANDPRFARWREYEVYAKYVDLLESIGAHHPETFHGLVAASSIMQGMSLNVLAATVNGFVSIPFSRLTEHHIDEYRRVFLDLEHMGFNINWMLNRLDSAEEIRFSGPLYDEYVATTWRITEIHNEMTRLQGELCPLEARQLDLLDKLETSFGAVGVSLALGALGEGLL